MPPKHRSFITVVLRVFLGWPLVLFPHRGILFSATIVGRLSGRETKSLTQSLKLFEFSFHFISIIDEITHRSYCQISFFLCFFFFYNLSFIFRLKRIWSITRLLEVLPPQPNRVPMPTYRMMALIYRSHDLTAHQHPSNRPKLVAT